MNFLAEQHISPGEFRQLAAAVDKRNLPAAVTGLSNIHKAHLIYSLCRRYNGRRAFVVAEDESQAQRIVSDLSAMGLKTAFYPARDFNFRNTEGRSHEYEQQRLNVLAQLADRTLEAVVTCIDAVLQYTIPAEQLAEKTLILRTGAEISLDTLAADLVTFGYERSTQVEGPGQFSVRGGIIDFFSPHAALPVRIELWGDEIDSMAHFDSETQRSLETAKEVTVIPATEVVISDPNALIEKIADIASSLRGKQTEARKILLSEAEKLRELGRLSSADKFITAIYDKTACLFDYMDNDLLFVSEYSKTAERARTAEWQQNEDAKAYFEEGVFCKGVDTFSFDWTDALRVFTQSGAVYLEHFPHGGFETPLKNLYAVKAQRTAPWGGSVKMLEEELPHLTEIGWTVCILAGTEKAAVQLVSELNSDNIPAVYSEKPEKLSPGEICVTVGGLSSGFQYQDIKFALITHGRLPEGQRKKRTHRQGERLYSLSDLTIGDYVVHSVHGIGIFEGVTKIEQKDLIKDYIKIAYAKGDVLFVPVSQLDLVSKYIGSKENAAVKIHRMGGGDWQKAKARVKSAVKDIARELIRLYALRQETKGHAFGEDGEWQHDFEAKFPYTETEDQLRCAEDIKNDMEKVTPMERLLCGDVGFGKTEVALRAAFKCVTEGKQCVLMVPTTILAWQHFQTVNTRFEGFPVTVELLSRFRSPKQQKEILHKLRRGSIDMVIGTHRLVQKDVLFRDLGLAIIDEEQRFGVAHKEKFKQMCVGVDVLMLSATPIPRTLNMALSGLRDMSVIEEAPNDRHPVQSYVLEYDRNIILDAIRRELRRGGQVYYLHNRVESIEKTANGLQLSLPDARIGIAHGKMTEQELSEVWQRLIEHEIDILVCTTIIETGVDVPNANTLIMENADRMGLSQLHQLRGRVGRSMRRAYAYYTFPKDCLLTEIAQKRLSAIREYTEFGSGFKIAMRDLELRGAGNVLGGEQSGHLEAVGYDMYLKLLAQAVSEEKGEAPQVYEAECLVDIQVQAHLPEEYITNLSQRLEIYRRIADIRTQGDYADVMDELIDRFGEPSPSVTGLLDIALLRNTADRLGVVEIKQQNLIILFFVRQIEMDRVSALMREFKGRVMVSAGSKPHITFKLQKDNEPIKMIEAVLKAMDKAGVASQ